jgi:hypothetical protein
MIGALAFIAMSWSLGQRPAEHRKILGKDKSLAAVDGAPAGDDTVARHLGLFHAEFDRTVLDEHVELLETALVEQKLDALPRGQLAAGVLRLDAFLAAAEFGPRAPFLEGVQNVLHVRPPSLLQGFQQVLTRHFPNRKPAFRHRSMPIRRYKGE